MVNVGAVGRSVCGSQSFLSSCQSRFQTAHSMQSRDSVLDCGSPLPLFRRTANDPKAAEDCRSPKPRGLSASLDSLRDSTDTNSLPTCSRPACLRLPVSRLWPVFAEEMFREEHRLHWLQARVDAQRLAVQPRDELQHAGVVDRVRHVLA